MSKGSQTTSTQTSPPGYVQNAYQGLISNTNQLAQTPYTPYTGEGVAPLTPEQLTAVTNINNAAGEAQPYYQQGLGLLDAAGHPLTADQIQNYYSPYQQNVINTTQAQFDLMNKNALNNIQGNAVSQGALGGNRDAVAQAAYYQGVLPGQEQTIAGLENTGYGQAVNLAMQQYQQNPEAVAYGLGSLGSGAQAAGLQGAGAQFGVGTTQQQTQQALDQYLYNQYLALQGYPFALNQYAAGIDTGVGSLAGGTGVTTAPPPSSSGMIAGGLESALGAGMMFLPGGQIPGMALMGSGVGTMGKAALGGPVKGYALGGSPVMPYAGGPSYIPSASGLAHGSGPPRPPGIPQAPSGGGAGDMFGKAMSMAKMAQPVNPGNAPAVTDPLGPGPYQHGGRANYPGGLALPTHGRINLPMRGGMGMPSFVRGYQEGGSPNDSLFSPDYGKMYLAQQEAQAAYGNPVTTTTVPASQIAGDPIEGDVSTSPAGVAGDISGDLPGRVPASYEVPAGQRAGASAPAGLAYAPEHAPPGGGVYAPAGGIGGGYQLPPRLPPSERPSLLPSGRDLGFALMDAGFRTMAAASRPGATTLGAIGEGGVGGLHTYAGLKQGEANIEMESRKLDQQAQAESDRIQHEGEALQQQAQLHREMTPYQKAELALKAQEPKTIMGPDSMLHTVRKDPDTGKFIDIFTNQPIDVPPSKGGLPQEGVPTSQIPSKTQVAQLGEAPDGFSLQASKAIDAGQKFNYAADGPYIEKGMGVPEPQNVAGKSADTLKRDAEYYAATGKGLPPLARGNSPVALQTTAYRNAVQNYASALSASRGIDPQTQAMMWREAPLYGRFVMGVDGRAAVSLGTATRHLDTVRQLAQAWQANDIQTVNRLRAVISREFGSDAATNLDTVGKIVGPEIIKAIGVAGAGTDRERESAAAGFSATASPPQMLGAVDTVQKLLGGQLEGKMRQAKAAGLTDEQFKNLIGERPYEILTRAGAAGGAPAAATPAGGGLPAGVPQGSTHGISKSQGPGWKTPDGRFIPDKT